MDCIPFLKLCMYLNRTLLMGDIHEGFLFRRSHVRNLSTEHLSKEAILSLGSVNFDWRGARGGGTPTSFSLTSN
jgi:hypothetical protein